MTATIEPKSSGGWPFVLGMIAIVFGGLGVLSTPTQLFSKQLTQLQFQGMVNEGMAEQAEVDAFIEKWDKPKMITGLTAGVLALVLLLGGIFLIKRKKLGSLLLKIWAILFIIYMPISAYYMSNMVVDMFPLFLPTEEEAIIPTIMGLTKIGVWVSIVIYLIVPIFVLIWLNRAASKELVQSWEK